MRIFLFIFDIIFISLNVGSLEFITRIYALLKSRFGTLGVGNGKPYSLSKIFSVADYYSILLLFIVVY